MILSSGRLLAAAPSLLVLLLAIVFVAAAVLEDSENPVVLRLHLPFALALVVVLPVDPASALEVGLLCWLLFDVVIVVVVVVSERRRVWMQKGERA